MEQTFIQSLSPLKAVSKANSIPQMLHLPYNSEEEPNTIYEAPAGTTVFYDREFIGFYTYWYYLVFGKSNGGSHIVYTEDGYAYIFNPFGGILTDSYLRCEVVGDKLVATLPQPIYDEADYDNPEITHKYYASLLHKITDEDGNLNYVVKNETETISFSVNGDHLILDIEYDDTPDEEGYYSYPEIMFGMVDADGVWTVAGDCQQTYTKTDLSPIIAPDDLILEEWAMISGVEGRKVNIGFDGDDVYMSNFDENFPNAFVKGHVEDDRVTFDSGQYVGIIYSLYIYFMGGEITDNGYVLTDGISFKFDRENNVMTSYSNTCILLNAGTEESYYLSVYRTPEIKTLNLNPSPYPLPPVFADYDDMYEDYGFSYIEFNLPNINADKDLLDTSNMYYNYI